MMLYQEGNQLDLLKLFYWFYCCVSAVCESSMVGE